MTEILPNIPPPSSQSSQPFPGGFGETPSRLFNVNDNLLTVVNTTTETDIYSLEVPPNQLVPRQGVILFAHGDYLNDSGLNVFMTVHLYYGETELLNSISAVIRFNASLRAWTARYVLRPQVGDYDLQRIEGSFKLGDAKTPTSGYGTFGRELVAGPAAGVATEDSQVSQIMRLAIEHGTANASIILNKFSAYAEWIT